ncbi:MAG: DnaJ domain-containing protein [Gammaproteobacteria bacterium]|nr:DnaJ domain-containing protein [Gammaproteobacteria bacterium]NIM73172.1 DnaJ domain-containing protein [Gammaproteobacteria bacterium]NIN40008.1 DnaJ domain-containing protein [Gammaproteobacteria bacterium]NIO26222.1 DnaJ domain-containing protein [Gammaproteobacteria bacterium]NIO66031.1 DnaJ domain-containing protein [Gammaproteobacteria bacterium]
MHPVIILALLVGVLLFISWYKRAPSGQQKRIRGRMLLFGGLGILLLLLVTGHLNPVIAAIFAAFAIGQRVLSVVSMANMFKGIRNSMKGAAGPSAGNVSDVETRYLRMSLNHDTGEMEGVVLDGTFKGRRLSELGPDELMDLLGVCRAEDDQSASVLEAYLDRVHGDDWREHAGGPGREHAAEAARMSQAEAREILGVEAGASREEIVEAHRRLMQKNHPDRGGSTYIAAKINQAKEVLLA